MTWLDICRGRDLGDVNIALSKILFLMTAWHKGRAGVGRFSDITKVEEHDCPSEQGESSYGGETLFMWQCYTLTVIPPPSSHICAPPGYLKCAQLETWTGCGSVPRSTFSSPCTHASGRGGLIVFSMSRNFYCFLEVFMIRENPRSRALTGGWGLLFCSLDRSQKWKIQHETCSERQERVAFVQKGGQQACGRSWFHWWCEFYLDLLWAYLPPPPLEGVLVW